VSGTKALVNDGCSAAIVRWSSDPVQRCGMQAAALVELALHVML